MTHISRASRVLCFCFFNYKGQTHYSWTQYHPFLLQADGSFRRNGGSNCLVLHQSVHFGAERNCSHPIVHCFGFWDDCEHDR